MYGLGSMRLRARGGDTASGVHDGILLAGGNGNARPKDGLPLTAMEPVFFGPICGIFEVLQRRYESEHSCKHRSKKITGLSKSRFIRKSLNENTIRSHFQQRLLSRELRSCCANSQNGREARVS
jgi:hypothetical protein